MISGVRVKHLIVHRDIPDTKTCRTPGFLIEIVRDDDRLLKRFGQSTCTVAYHGTIKAFHWHKKQDDLWFVATGKARIALYDLRRRSRTYGQTQEIVAGEGAYKVIRIPAGVAHGYKVISRKPVLLFYHTTRHYDARHVDEERIPYNDPRINVQWSKR